MIGWANGKYAAAKAGGETAKGFQVRGHRPCPKHHPYPHPHPLGRRRDGEGGASRCALPNSCPPPHPSLTHPHLPSIQKLNCIPLALWLYAEASGGVGNSAIFPGLLLAAYTYVGWVR